VTPVPAARPGIPVPGRLAAGTLPVEPGGIDLAAARDLADAGRMAESREMVRSIIARDGPSAVALELLGLVSIAADDVAGAKRLFEQAVYLEPQRAACLLQLAMISERAGDPQRASMYWDRARRASAAWEPER
jgi:chemotaxis protein methyltransferase WspC